MPGRKRTARSSGLGLRARRAARGLGARSYELRATSYELRATSYELRAAFRRPDASDRRRALPDLHDVGGGDGCLSAETDRVLGGHPRFASAWAGRPSERAANLRLPPERPDAEE